MRTDGLPRRLLHALAARRWEHNDVGERKYHYYADQSAQPYFQSNRETLIGRQLLLQTLFSVVNAHMAYNSSAGEVPFSGPGRAVHMHASRAPARVRTRADGLAARVPRWFLVVALSLVIERFLLRPPCADTYNDTVQNLEVPRGDCPAASTPRFHLDDRRLREASFKWMLRRQVERVGKLRELELGGMEMHHFDQALETTWNKVLYQHFVATWGRKHRCATPGGCAACSSSGPVLSRLVSSCLVVACALVGERVRRL